MNTFFPRLIFLLSVNAFLNNLRTFLSLNLETKEMQVNALVMNPILPEVKTPEFG